MTDGADDEDDRTQRLVAELAEVRRRMSKRAIPVAPKSRADGSGSNSRISTAPPTSTAPSMPPTAANGSTPPRPPTPALGHRIPTQRIVTEAAPTGEEGGALSRRPTKP
jgi:hypothetical protein